MPKMQYERRNILALWRKRKCIQLAIITMNKTSAISK
jgi:hypothetical protein